MQTIDKLGSILDRQHLELQWHFALELGARQVLLVRSDELWTFTKQLSKQILRAGDLDYTVSGEGIWWGFLLALSLESQSHRMA